MGTVIQVKTDLIIFKRALSWFCFCSLRFHISACMCYKIIFRMSLRNYNQLKFVKTGTVKGILIIHHPDSYNSIIIGSDNGLSSGRHQVIIWTNFWNITDWTLWNKVQWNFKRNSNIFIQENVFKMSSEKRRPFCLGFNTACFINVVNLRLRRGKVSTSRSFI